MSDSWSEVYDNEEVQFFARSRATHAVMAAVVTAVLLLFCAGLVLGNVLPLPSLIAFILLTWLAMTGWIIHRLRELRRIVWCIKLSRDKIIGYDYTRQKSELPWAHVQRVELNDDGLLIAGNELCHFEVTHLYPEFAALSHRIVQCAEAHGVPVCVDGQPWEDLDVYQLFPFLAENSCSSD